MLNPAKIKKDFPIFTRKINGKPLVYLDNAATTQKPKTVINAVAGFYRTHNATVHRAVYTIAEEATRLYEETREKTARFIGAKDPHEIVFVRNTTEALNLVAHTLGFERVQRGDNIVITEMEHHSNLVPWQMLAKTRGARLRFIPFDQNGKLDIAKLPKLVDRKTKIISLVHVSNLFGTINPVEKIVRTAKKENPDIVTIIDGAQSVPHMEINVNKIGCDFFAFSSHKMCGPSGIGVLWGRKEVLEAMPPFMTGGSMIGQVSYDKAEWAEVPQKFEAGTPNIEGAVGLGAAVDYISQFSFKDIRAHELELTEYAIGQMKKIKGLEVIGPKNPRERGGLVAFTVKGIHPHDIASFMNDDGIAIRVGHHCVMPAHTKLDIPASARISFYIYNDKKDVDACTASLEKLIKIFG